MEGCYAYYSGSWQCFWVAIILLSIVGIFISPSVEKDLGLPQGLGIIGSIVWIVFSLYMIIDLMIKCGG